MLVRLTPKMLKKVNEVRETAEGYSTEKINGPEEVYKILKSYFNSLDIVEREKERFIVLGLDARNTVKYMDVVSVGTLSNALVHPREVFRTAVLAGVNSIIVAHNHPSGTPSPSEDDKKITRRLIKAGKIIGIEVLDHIIVTDKGFFSFKKEELIKSNIKEDTK